MKILYRLEIDYYSQECENRCCSTSEPIYSLQEGIEKYLAAITEKCIDDNSKYARVELWKYGEGLNERGMLWKEKTVMKNF